MPVLAKALSPTLRREPDQRVFLHNVSWRDYERILAIRGEGSGVRITYLQGEVELMSPSIHHEMYKKRIARLLEAYAEEHGLDLNGYGSWTVSKREQKLGVEPDECYVWGAHRPKRPDLAIEVIWTSGGLDKLEIYRGLGVPEVWMWRDGAIEVHVLREGAGEANDAYERATKSSLLPELDLDLLASFLDRPGQTQAVREYRAALRIP